MELQVTAKYKDLNEDRPNPLPHLKWELLRIWDLASGNLKLSLTGHISTVRGLAVSDRHPYLFSAGEDKQVKCWDLEQNKVVRHYHGHLSAVYSLALHPTLDILITGGRDSVARVWDMRTKQPIHVLTGHTAAVNAVICQAPEPQVVTASNDSTVRLWDLAAGKTRVTYTFAAGSPDRVKKYLFPHGEFLHDFIEGGPLPCVINAMAISEDNVMVTGSDDGALTWYDWRSGRGFQREQSIPQPGSLDSEAGIFAATFDRSGLRLITGEADKSIKIWKESSTDYDQ
ncbi:putative pleiotropic regulator [Mitosporidium daphniae]|uniref:Putative pleiotropic regulator n=1 Tax=Mitosporidium daphniae TaxID=1485682 RepID=A0A098VMQ7_9MICR|nr:putative pleiotropic regulator [Mitosporidium daphniae]KGG50250.1 putative pleiotropic regulator [Mitosporidium daphniae]|eukprot:XP_013236677.1 putative pleiotropic regulator [Mitosporidium daphniae]